MYKRRRTPTADDDEGDDDDDDDDDDEVDDDRNAGDGRRMSCMYGGKCYRSVRDELRRAGEMECALFAVKSLSLHNDNNLG